MRPRYFWTTSLVGALVFAAAAALLFPYGPLQIDTTAGREQAWLLTLWTAGVMAICFGASGLLASFAPLGFRDVADAGSVRAAVEARQEERSRQGSNTFYNFAGWTVSMGFWLVIVYFIGWITLGL
ncbi:MAG: hypothetical protein WD737_01225 [Gemmatimonadota bacterium]